MFRLNLVFVLLLVNVSAYAEDEKFIGCQMERFRISTPLAEMERTHGFRKFNQPLISIKDGKFTMLKGNSESEELFPDGIEYHFIGEPKFSKYSNTYQWDYVVSISESYPDWSVSINRESLDMREFHRSTSTWGNFGERSSALDKYYSCRLIDKESFEKYKTEMSEEYMKQNVDARKKEKEEQTERERERKNKI